MGRGYYESLSVSGEWVETRAAVGGRGRISFSSLEELDFSLGLGWTSLGHLNKSTRHSGTPRGRC